MSDQRRSMNARRESLPPGSRIVTPRCINHMARQAADRSRGETLAQQPRRLHRHADAFGNDGMGLAGRVAYKKNAIESTPPDAWPNRPGRLPVALQPGARERLARRATRLIDVREHGLAGLYRPCRAPRALELVPADATGEADTPMVAVDHPAVSARKSQER